MIVIPIREEALEPVECEHVGARSWLSVTETTETQHILHIGWELLCVKRHWNQQTLMGTRICTVSTTQRCHYAIGWAEV